MANRSEPEFERRISNLLRAGVAMSAAVVLGGGVFFLVAHSGDAADYRAFQPTPYRDLAGILNAARHGDAQAIVQLGLILLIATPVARVALSSGFSSARMIGFT